MQWAVNYCSRLVTTAFPDERIKIIIKVIAPRTTECDDLETCGLSPSTEGRAEDRGIDDDVMTSRWHWTI